MDLLEREGLRIEWEAIGEGRSGDYNPDDPNDVELLRFYVQRLTDEGWEDVEDGSYCTNVPVSATPEQREALLRMLHDRIDPDRRSTMEEASWVSLDWLSPTKG